MRLKTFIPLHFSLNSHPKLLKLCALLNKTTLDERLSIRARLENLWLWTMQYFPLGTIELCSPIEIALACSWTGDPNDWLSALIDCDFLERTESGFKVVNWEEYGGKWITKRQQDALRKQRSRSHSSDPESNPDRFATNPSSEIPVESPLPDSSIPPDTLSLQPSVLETSWEEPVFTPENHPGETIVAITAPLQPEVTSSHSLSSHNEKECGAETLSGGCHADNQADITSQANLLYDLYPRQGAKAASLKTIKKALRQAPFSTLFNSLAELTGTYIANLDEMELPLACEWFDRFLSEKPLAPLPVS